MNKKELLKLKNVLLLSTLVLTSGCGNKNDDIQKNQYGEERNFISYDSMKDYKFLVLDNMDENEVNYYLAKVNVNEQDARLVFYEYYDVLTDNNTSHSSTKLSSSSKSTQEDNSVRCCKGAI